MPFLFRLANFQLASIARPLFAVFKWAGQTMADINEGDGQLIARQAHAAMVVDQSNITCPITLKLS